MGTPPCALSSPALMFASSFVALKTVVVCATWFHSTTAPGAKPCPVTRSRKEPAPAYTADGLSEVMVGFGGGGALMVNISALDGVPLAPLTTVICALPAVVSRFAGTWAVSDVELVKLVIRLVSCPPLLHRATEVFVKPVPVKVKLRAAEPATAEDGFSDVNAGAGGAAIVNGNAKSWVPLRNALTCQLPDSFPAIDMADAAHPAELTGEGCVWSTVPDGWTQLYDRTSPAWPPVKLNQT